MLTKRQDSPNWVWSRNPSWPWQGLGGILQYCHIDPSEGDFVAHCIASRQEMGLGDVVWVAQDGEDGVLEDTIQKFQVTGADYEVTLVKEDV